MIVGRFRRTIGVDKCNELNAVSDMSRMRIRRKMMVKNFTIKPPRKVGGTGRSATTAGAVGFGAVMLVLGGLVMLGNKILDTFKRPEA